MAENFSDDDDDDSADGDDPLIDIYDNAKAVWLDAKHTKHAYFPPSSEPLDWHTKGKVVPLSVAIYALHLCAARVGVKSLPGFWRQKLIGWGGAALRQAAAATAERVITVAALKQAVKRLVSTFVRIVDIFDAILLAQEQEELIRRRSLQTMRELHLLALEQQKGKRTKKVLTRR